MWCFTTEEKEKVKGGRGECRGGGGQGGGRGGGGKRGKNFHKSMWWRNLTEALTGKL